MLKKNGKTNVITKEMVSPRLYWTMREFINLEIASVPTARLWWPVPVGAGHLLRQRGPQSRWRERWSRLSGVIGYGSKHIQKDGIFADGLIRESSIFATVSSAHV